MTTPDPNTQFSVVSDLGSLPDHVIRLAGKPALERIFADQGVPIEILDNRDAPLSVRDCSMLFTRAAAITGDRSFGLRVGKDHRLDAFGPIGAYFTTAKSLPAALNRCSNTVRYTKDYAHQFCEYSGDSIRLGYRNIGQFKSNWRHRGDVILCSIILLFQDYLGKDWHPDRIEVTYREGPWAQDLEDHFGVPVIFEQPAEAVVFRRCWLTAPTTRRPTRQRLVTRADVERYARRVPGSQIRAIQQTIYQRLLLGQTDLEGLAEKLATGPRTLQRRLAGYGLAYRDLLGIEINRRTFALLAEPDLNLDEIARDIGFAGRTQFIRAFRNQNNVTPGEFRQNYLGMDGNREQIAA